MTDLDNVSFFLAIFTKPTSLGNLFLTQEKYTQEIVEIASIMNYNNVATSIDPDTKLGVDAGPPITDPTHYRSLAGAL